MGNHSNCAARLVLFYVLTMLLSTAASGQGIPDERNVNIIGINPPAGGLPDSGLKQQNESVCGKKPTNPLHILCVFNDYRGVDNPIIGDAWQGWSWTINGGQTWFSDIVPAHLGDAPNLGFEFAADPFVTAAPGLALVTYIVGDRGENADGALQLHRFFEVNREAGTPWLPEMLPVEVARGNAGQFVDKPVHLLHLSSPGSGTVMVSSTLKDGSPISQEVPAGRLFVAYTIFLNNKTKLMVAHSDDYGESWRETKLSETQAINQSASLAAHGDDVCAVWRRFERKKQVDAILVACSSDRGGKWSKSRVVSEEPEFFPFDQPTTETTFRTNSYPVIASDGDTFYAVWASRIDSVSPFFSRIVYSMSADGGDTWTTPTMIEDAALGHQYMPDIAVSRGTVQVLWHDTRNDLFQGVQIEDVLDDSTGTPPTKVIRQLGDLRTAQIVDGLPTASTQVSKYLHGVRSGGDGSVEQLQFNFLNDRIFKTGTVPFNGDYPHIAFPLFRLEAAGWVSNASFSPDGRPDEALVTWSDTRDVFGNVWEDLSDPTVYTPANQTAMTENAAGTTNAAERAVIPALTDHDDDSSVSDSAAAVADSVRADAEDDPTDNYPVCSADGLNRDRSRNQNVYSSVVRPGVSIESPSADKPTGSVQRAHVVWVSNNTTEDGAFVVTIDNQPADAPVDGRASFLQVPVAPFADDTGLLTTIDVNIEKNSTVARTVFVTSSLPHTPVEVSVSDGAGTVLGTITLNADIATPDIQNPDVQNPDVQNPDIQNAEVHNPDVQNPVITTVQNPDVQNPDIQNPDIQNPDVQNPDVQNPDVQNPDIQNPDIQNETLEGSSRENPDVENDTLTDQEREDGYTDVTWEVENDGNTVTAFNVDAFVNGDTSQISTQLIGTRTHITETSRDCVQLRQVQNQVIFNLINPDLSLLEENTNAGIFGDGSAYVAPGETIFVTLRIWGDPNFPEDRTGVRVEAQSCNSADKGAGTTECDPPFEQIGTPDEPPVINVPASPVSLEAFDNDGFDGAFADILVTVTDDIDSDVDLTCEAVEETFDGVNEVSVQFDVELGDPVQVNCMATDSVGNLAEESFVVEAVDTTPPTIFFDSSDGTEDFEFITSLSEYTVLYLGELIDVDLQNFAPLHVTVSDSVDDDVADSLSCAPPSGSDESVFPGSLYPGTATTVTCSATDASGNMTQRSFDVIVIIEPIV